MNSQKIQKQLTLQQQNQFKKKIKNWLQYLIMKMKIIKLNMAFKIYLH